MFRASCQCGKKKIPKMFGDMKESYYLCRMNVKQEFGKWFLDVAKYVLTAMLLSSMIEGLNQMWLLTVTAAVTVLCLLFGAILLRKGRVNVTGTK